MTNYDVTIYNSLYEAEQALEGIDNAINIVAIPFKDGVLTKVMVMQGTSDANDISLSGVTNSTLSALKVIEQAPLDQQVLDETLLDAVTSTGASTDVYTLDKNGITIEITASSVSTGGTIKIQGTSDNTNIGTAYIYQSPNSRDKTIKGSVDICPICKQLFFVRNSHKNNGDCICCSHSCSRKLNFMRRYYGKVTNCDYCDSSFFIQHN